MKKTISITSNIINKIARWGKVINDVTIAIVTIALATIGYFTLCKKFFGIDMIAAIKDAFTPEPEEDEEEDTEYTDFDE
jgi:hypothetical protein